MENIFKILENGVVRKVALVGAISFLVATFYIRYANLDDSNRAVESLRSQKETSVKTTKELQSEIKSLQEKADLYSNWINMSEKDKESILSENKEMEKELALRRYGIKK